MVHLENKSSSSFCFSEEDGFETGTTTEDFSTVVLVGFFCSAFMSTVGDDGVALFEEDVDVLVLTCLPLGTITVARPVIFSSL